MAAAVVAFVVAVIALGSPQAAPQPSPAPPPVAIDIVTVPSGVPLAPAELAVTVDGRPRTIIGVRSILRGPGSERAAAETQTGSQRPLAETSRTIIFVVDQTSLARGNEKKVAALIARVLDLIAPADRAALIPLPLERTSEIAVSTDRRAMWTALGKIRVGSASAPLALAHAEEPPPLPDDEARDPRSAANEERPETDRDRQPGLARAPDARQDIAERTPGFLQELRGLLTSLSRVPDAKTILLIRGTESIDAQMRLDQAGADRLESSGLPQLAASARATLHTVTLGDRWRASRDEATRLARLTGGDEFRLGKKADLEIGRLGAWLSEGLRITVEGAPEDFDGRSHQIAVTSTRRDVSVSAPRQWLPFEADEPAPIAPAPPSAIAAPPVASSAATPGRTVDPELTRVLARMSAYVAQYLEDFSAVVAEEAYDQRVTSQLPRRVAGPTARTLRSDFLLVLVPGEKEWTPFRDVFEVNGKPIRDRDDRLRKLFIEMPPDALDKARKILDEGARYNLGSMYRNVNLPVLPLVFLMPQYVRGLEFRRAGEDSIEGVRAWRIDFQETARPALIKNDREHRDLPSTGSFWVDPTTGRILKTRIRITDTTLKMDTTVVYRRSETLHLWAPAEMEELYLSGAERLTGSARYKNFRRFRVDVEEHIAVPKGTLDDSGSR